MCHLRHQAANETIWAAAHGVLQLVHAQGAMRQLTGLAAPQHEQPRAADLGASGLRLCDALASVEGAAQAPPVVRLHGESTRDVAWQRRCKIHHVTKRTYVLTVRLVLCSDCLLETQTVLPAAPAADPSP